MKKTKPKKTTAPEKVLVLRTCNADMTSHGGFKWPESGLVEATDWKPTKECGNGLHGLLWGIGDYSLTNDSNYAKWLAVEVDSAGVIDLDGKVKFQRGDVVFCGDYARAATFVSRHWIEFQNHASGHSSKLAASGHSSNLAASGAYSNLAASGHYSNLAASGAYSNLAASGHSSNLAASGDRSNLAASGHSSNLAASGAYSKLAASGHYSNLAASGDCSKLAASGHYSNLAASGDCSNLAASGDCSASVAAAYRCTVSAGDNGLIAAMWKDSKGRPRLTVGYVGEDGIKPNVAYKVDDQGKFIEA